MATRKRKKRTGNGSRANTREGYCERHFSVHLITHFNKFIHLNLILRKYEDYPYTADFAYIDEVNNIWIDIEIDEPYYYITREPTHYLGDNKQTARDNYFRNRDWFIIRFSEKQVARYPENCCRTIADFISQIRGFDCVPDSLRALSPVSPTQRWTYENAIDMANNNYRDTYTDCC